MLGCIKWPRFYCKPDDDDDAVPTNFPCGSRNLSTVYFLPCASISYRAIDTWAKVDGTVLILH